MFTFTYRFCEKYKKIMGEIGSCTLQRNKRGKWTNKQTKQSKVYFKVEQIKYNKK